MENIRTAMNRGAFDFVTKPIDFNDLSITIEKTVKHIDTLQQALQNRDRLVALKQELEVARHVQTSSLPEALPEGDDFDIGAVMTPAREIGGDFYDFFQIDNYRMGLVIADVSDKGVPAALITMVTRALLKSAANRHDSPGACLAEVNEFLSQDNDACMFVTLFYGVLDFRDGCLRYSNGGHNPPRIIRADGAVEGLDPTGDLALGVFAGHGFKEREISVAVGDTLFLYTDGITEACNPVNDEYGEGRLDDLLGRIGAQPSQDVVRGAVESVEKFADGAAQFDDMTCLTLRLKALRQAADTA